jgi:hypothetical protein
LLRPLVRWEEDVLEREGTMIFRTKLTSYMVSQRVFKRNFSLPFLAAKIVDENVRT